MKTTYDAWANMKQRCTNASRPDFHYYGGRGINYSPEWETYKGFVRDMGNKPQGTELDRIDNAKGYNKDNCRWASKVEQAGNKRTYQTNQFGIGGVTYCKKTGKFRARAQLDGQRVALYTGRSFFEACCARMSWENKHG